MAPANPLASTDQQAIADLTITYAWTIDTRRFADLEQVFLSSATFEVGSGERVLRGIDEITAFISSVLTPLDASQHLVSNHQVRVDGDRATCRCQLQAQHVRQGAEGGPNYIVAGHYDDVLVRTNSGWRIAERHLTRTWTEGNTEVVAR